MLRFDRLFCDSEGCLKLLLPRPLAGGLETRVLLGLELLPFPRIPRSAVRVGDSAVPSFKPVRLLPLRTIVSGREADSKSADTIVKEDLYIFR